MPGIPVEQATDITARQRDISSWHTCDTTTLNARQRKEYTKRKAAIEAYFTSEMPIKEIARRYYISPRTLSRLARRCLKQHEDGELWGFRALVPGAMTKTHTTNSVGAPFMAPNDTSDAPVAAPFMAPNDTSDAPVAAPFMAPNDTSDAPVAAPFMAPNDTAPLSQEPPTGEETLTSDEPAEPAPSTEEETAPLISEETPVVTATIDADTDTAAEVDEEANEKTEKLAAIHPATPPFRQEAEGEIISETSLADTAEPTAPLKDETALATPAATDETISTDNPVGAPFMAPGDMPADDETISTSDEAAGTQFIAPANTSANVSTEDKTAPADEETAPLVAGDAPVAAPFMAPNDMAVNETTTTSLLAPEDIPAAGLPVTSAYRIIGKSGVQHRVALKRRGRVTARKRRKRFWRIASVVVLVALLIVIAMPLATGLAAYSAYNNVNSLARDGLNHLLDAKALLHFSKSDPTAVLNAANLQRAQSDFQASESDFQQLQQLVDRQDIQTAVTEFAPQYASKLDMAQRLVQVGLDVSRMGQELSGVGLIAASIMHSSPLASGSNKPLVSPADFSAVEAAITHALYYISDVQTQMSQVSVSELPISASQKTQLTSLMGQLPGIESQLTQAQSDVGMVAWLLGIGHPRRFLVQTMDTAELRPGGGFTGDYGVLQINNGRMSPFTLTDVTLIDYAENGTAIGRSAPPGYSWMNFGNWGVRDSNLSGDFPTTARMTMQVFEQEGGGPVDGDIALTPAVIAHVLYATGPIKVPGYNVTVTPQNLEYWIHYYQQNPLAIAQEKQISGNYSHSGRKAFTGTVGQILLSRVRKLPPSKLVGIFKQAIKDIQSRDLEIYFTDPNAEAWLVRHGYSSSLSTFSSMDGFAVVQANISISKASQYVQTTLEDDVTLDKSGGATHNLTITLNYQQRGPVYGYDTYADYIRVYAPPNASFLGGDGFDTGHALCTPKGTSSTPPGTNAPPPKNNNCAQYATMFPSAARYCPNGDYSLGERGYIAGKGYTLWPYDSLGGPTELTSDLPGRSMWGGLTETPKNCISYISLSWYVPHAVKKINGQPVYTFLMQKQSGVSPILIVNIDASAIRGLKSYHYNHIIYSDRQFVLQPPPKKH